MKNVKIKLPKQIYEKAVQIALELNIELFSYLTDAIVSYNSFQQKKLLAEQLNRESELVREDSMKVLREFDSLDQSDQQI